MPFLTLFFLSFLFVSCDNSSMEEVDTSKDINLFNCYSLNKEQCVTSIECKIWETINKNDYNASRDDYNISRQIGIRHFIYDRSDFCIYANSISPVFIGCMYRDTDLEIISLAPIIVLDDMQIYKNKVINQYIIINKTGWIGSENGTNWELDQDAWNELADYFQKENQNYFKYQNYCN